MHSAKYPSGQNISVQKNSAKHPVTENAPDNHDPIRFEQQARDHKENRAVKKVLDVFRQSGAKQFFRSRYWYQVNEWLPEFQRPSSLNGKEEQEIDTKRQNGEH